MKKIYDLLEDAGHSYLIYDSFAQGVVNIVNLKWPDALMSAIEALASTNEDDYNNAIEKLELDLGILIYKPIEIIAEALLIRVKDVIDANVLYEKLHKALEICTLNPQEAKKLLISIIESSTVILSAANGTEYPKIPKKIKLCLKSD